MRACGCTLVAAVLLLIGPLRADTPAGPGPARLSPDERLLQAASLDATGAALVQFFRSQAEPNVDPKQLETWLADLVQPAAERHRPAAAALVSLGVSAAPALRSAANNLDDHDAAERARQCLRFVDGPMAGNLASAATRLLAQRRPPEAAAALLAYLPSAPDDRVVRAVETALGSVARVQGKLEPSLLKALDDPLAVRRAAAAAVLCRVGKPAERAAVRRLFRDPRPTVRMRAALGLAHHDDPEAVPLLIELLAELPPPQRAEVERFLTNLAGTPPLYLRAGEATVDGRTRRDVWAAWWQSMQGDALLHEFRSRTLSDADRTQILAAIRKLGSEEFAERDRAALDLVVKGAPAASLLRQAARDPDPQVRKNAAGCLQLLERAAPPLPPTLVRVLGLRRPPGTVETLLAYLPFADTPDVADKVRGVLTNLAYHDGQPDAALIKALEDGVPIRRVIAAELLYRNGPDNLKEQARKLLNDPDLPTRLRFALFLVDQHERSAVPVLIALLGELPAEQAAEAEDALRYLAGDQAPTVFLEGGATATRCRDAWQAWWRQHGEGLDLAQLDGPDAASWTLLVEQPSTSGRGRLAMIDQHGQVLWQFGVTSHIYEARPVSNDRFLLADPTTRQVSERDDHGAVVWKHDLGNHNPLSAYRLRNGNTFIVCQNYLTEVDPQGKEVFSHTRQSHDIVTARKWPDGQAAFLTNSGTYTRLDDKGKVVRSFTLPAGQRVFSAAYVELLPNDHVIVQDTQNGFRLVEHDARGQPCGQLPLPSHATGFERLPNGHTLAVLGLSQVVELDRGGKTVWEYSDPSFRPYQARRVRRSQ